MRRYPEWAIGARRQPLRRPASSMRSPEAEPRPTTRTCARCSRRRGLRSPATACRRASVSRSTSVVYEASSTSPAHGGRFVGLSPHHARLAGRLVTLGARSHPAPARSAGGEPGDAEQVLASPGRLSAPASVPERGIARLREGVALGWVPPRTSAARGVLRAGSTSSSATAIDRSPDMRALQPGSAATFPRSSGRRCWPGPRPSWREPAWCRRCAGCVRFVADEYLPKSPGRRAQQLSRGAAVYAASAAIADDDRPDRGADPRDRRCARSSACAARWRR